MKQRAPVGGVYFQFLFRVTRSAERLKIGKVVRPAVARWHAMMSLRSVVASAQGAAAAVPLKTRTLLLFPVAHVRVYQPPAPEHAALSALPQGLPMAVASSATNDPVVGLVGLKRGIASDAPARFCSSAAPSIRSVASIRTELRSPDAAFRNVERAAANLAARFSSVLHHAYIVSREAEYIAIAEQRIANVAPLFSAQAI